MSRRKTRTFRKKKLLIISIIIVAIIAIIVSIFFKKDKTTLQMTPELSRTQVYDDVVDGDEAIFDADNNQITAVQFDAFFLKDKDGDGISESIRGTCNEIGSESNLYMEVKVLEEGQLKDATITINSNNFYFNTSIVKDSVIAKNYISPNTKTIEFNEIENGSQALLIGSVRSGDYSSALSKTSAIGNDTSKYSMENSVTFSGTFVNSEGLERRFTKTVPFIVDWYGEVNCEITPQAQTIKTSDFSNFISEDGITLSFNINTTETENQLIMSESYISGTIPELNGYKPTSVKISGTNVTYTYDEETGKFTAQREAVLNEQGVITSNAYTKALFISGIYNRKNTFDFTVVYPLKAYQELGDDITNMELSIPVEAVNKGYNNPNKEDGFENPYTSNTATGIVVTTFKKPGLEYAFDIYVGTYMETPYKDYVISKKKPINIYNGISLEETDDTYLVKWRAYTGASGITGGIIMNETAGKTDSFLNTSATYISMGELTTNKGIYFTGATETLGSNGWIKIYDADTNTLIETFTSKNWNRYSSSNPYIYENKVKHIRVETSQTNKLCYFYVYNVKELDDEYITENFTREEFDNLSYIYSYLDGYMLQPSDESTNENTYLYKESDYNKALYAAPTSVASISIHENTISTKATAENEKITIKAESSEYNEQGWKNGIFLVKLPSEVILAEINSVTIDNSNVTISAYDIYEENGSYYIKILTENTVEDTYNIVVVCNLTPDPRIPKTTGTIELYAKNETACDYYYSGEDTYDIDGNANLTEKINYRTISLTMDPGTSLTTTQIGSNYGDNGNITLAPRVAKTDKDQRTATITISTTNNYNYDIKDIKIQGVVPFEGNKYVISGRDLGSTFTAYMSEAGISAVTENLENYAIIYYSTTETPTNDLNDKANGWTLAEKVTDWSKIKTYLIVLDETYKIEAGKTIEFQYEISLPEGVDYNEVTYSEHAIYFALATDEGLYYTSTGCEKLGFMIAKQYDLEIIKYQKDTNKTLQGITFTLTENGQESSSIKITDTNGIAKFIGLYAERYYTLKEEKTTDDYVLNNEEIKFYTYTQIDEDGTESLHLQYVNNELQPLETGQKYSSIISESIVPINEDTGEDYKIQINITNEVKSKLIITKKDQDTGNVLKNVKFTLTGEGKEGEILTTNASGEINTSGLYLNKEYTLEEIRATGYYIPQTPIKFTITREDGKFKITNYTDNGSTVSNNLLVNDEIPTISLSLQNDKIPTYGLQLTKYAKNENNKVLERAQYKIYGEGIPEEGKIYTTDENGILTIDGLYEYVEGKYITGEYTLIEIYAPEGYALDSTPLKFKAYRENGTLKTQIIEGQSVIRTITNSQTGEEEIDLSIINETSTYPTIQIGVEDRQIFTLFKYREGEIANEKIPIEGTMFMITDLDGNYVTGSDGKIIGEWIDTTEDETDPTGYYALTTDENGLITANLQEGLYKAIEIYADDKYVFDKNIENRTYYFGIGTSQAATWDWVNSINGQGWDYVNSVAKTSDGGVIGVGSFSEYSNTIVADANDGIDISGDGVIDKISQGSNDGIIVSYDADGNYGWSKIIGGEDDDSLNKVVQTSDGGYAVVGYVTSKTVLFDGKTEIKDISLSNTETNLANKDAVLIKLNSNGDYEWGVRLGGTADDEIKSVIETSEGNLVVVGSYFSSTFNFYEYNAGTSSGVVDSFTNLGTMDGFIASYSETGKYQWSQRIGGEYDVEIVDVTETSVGIAVAVNHISTVYLNTDKTTSQGGGVSCKNGTVVGYNLDGTYSWRYRFYQSSSSYNVEISALDTSKDGNIVVGVNYAYILYGSKNGGTATKIVDTEPNSNLYDGAIIQLSNDGTYDKLLYKISGNYDDYISDVEATSDGGVLLGGWYYSTNGIDVDGDGETTGENDLPTVQGEYTSDGFVIKLDSKGTVKYSSRLYGDGYEGVTSVTQTKSGDFVSGGYYNSKTLSATNFKIKSEDEEEQTEVILTGKGNSEGFVISEGATGVAVVPMSQTIEVLNEIKELKITTEVKKHTEGTEQIAGGDIDGEEGTFGGVDYSKDGIRYVEKVTYGENSTKQITITPDSGYVISYININNVEYTNFTTNENGITTIPIFENVTEDIHIVVEFSNTVSGMEVNHYLWTVNDGTTTTKVDESEFNTGEIGTTYKTEPKTDIDYQIITNGDYYGIDLPEGTDAEDYYIPENYTGTYQTGKKEVINYYYKEKTYTLTVHHYIDGTNESVPLKNGAEGEKVIDEVTENLAKNYKYETAQASENLINYEIYELVSTPENATGIIENNTEVTYYYKIKTADISITKVAEEDHSVTLSGTEFALYKYVANSGNDGSNKNNLIDITNVASCWTQVGTYTSSDIGVIKLEDLPITEEYRLVETKAADGRMIPDGQWKIEFVYGDYDKTDTSIVTVGGTKLRITAIGNPPAIAITEEGELQLPNKEYFNFPTSGKSGITAFYKVGISVVALGIVILVIRQMVLKKRNSLKKRHK